MSPRTAAGRALSKGVVHGMEAIRARADAGQPMKAWDYYRQMNMWDAYKPFVQEAHDDRLELLDLIEAEADRSLLLDAALRRLVAWTEKPTIVREDFADILDDARAALAATDVRGALGRTLLSDDEASVERFRSVYHTRVHEDEGLCCPICDEEADAILAALAAKGVE